jgi:excinuclease ABC subunit A
MQRESQTLPKTLNFLLQKGYTRVYHNGKLQKIEVLIENADSVKNPTEDLKILIDRFVVTKDDEDNAKRIADSSQIALQEGQGICILQDTEGNQEVFNNKFELDGMSFEEPSPQLFNFNSSFGACPSCEGYGQVMGIDEDKVIPDKTKSIFEEAIVCWRGEKIGRWRQKFLNVAHQLEFPVHTPYRELTEEQRRVLWTGNELFDGIDTFFKELEAKTYKIQNRVMLARYRGKTKCPTCGGSRLRKEALHVYIGGKTIADLIHIPIEDFYAFFENLELSDTDYEIARRLIIEITTRLQFMLDVGLNYLAIDRISSTLSGGEIQRIHLTRSLGSNLTSSLYILDEPSIGLHPRDTTRLVKVLRALRDLGNTVVVVEHEEDIISSADYLIDIGPQAGVHGGKVVFAGPYEDIHSDAADCLTAKYMSGRMSIPIPTNRRTSTQSITIKGARQHNLKDIDVTFPLNTFIAVSGVSGSGKTTLIKQILYPAMMHQLGEGTEKPGAHSSIEGDTKAINRVEMVSQQPIGKSSRSNPVTYVKAYDAIRKLFSSQQGSKIKGFKPKHFSFNVEGGRCETCKGAGETIVSMQFLADVRLTCDDCNGNRFQNEVLGIRYKEKNIYDILNLTVEEALVFFADNDEIISKIQPLYDVGLGYIGLGQPSSTLSGGEAQRVKLASFLAKENSREKILFIFDEPTTGLHFHDIQKLLDAFNALVEIGHSIIVIEHNLDVIKSADYVIDLGRDGGIKGGELLFQGTPEDLTKVENSYTGEYLKEKL